jgi:hypothetical protein
MLVASLFLWMIVWLGIRERSLKAGPDSIALEKDDSGTYMRGLLLGLGQSSLANEFLKGSNK